MLNQLSKTIAPLGLTFFLSVLITTLLQSYLHPDMSPPPQSPKLSATKKSSLKERGFGSSSGGSGIGSEPLEQPKEPRPPTTPYRITFQPKALYTDQARANGIQGAVRLKIVLL